MIGSGHTMPAESLSVLFLCTHNSARSILAEALLNHLGGGRFRAFSAGRTPRQDRGLDPLVLEVMRGAGVPTEGLRSKSWDELARPDASPLDLVITLCDQAAGEACTYWPGAPATAHWRYPDPDEFPGGKEDRRWAFSDTLNGMKRRLELLIAAEPDRFSLAAKARELGNVF